MKPTHTHPSVTGFPTVVPDADVYQTRGDSGNRALWIVFFIMFFSSLAFMAMAYRVPVKNRLFHQITTLITVFATLSYYAMAIGQGISFVGSEVAHEHKGDIPTTYHTEYREVYWARYVDWSLTTPLLLLDLTLLAGLNGSNTLNAMVADLIMILTGLFAAFAVEEKYKWGWYIMACVAYLLIIYNLAISARRTASARDAQVGRFFTAIAGYTLVLWTLYPVVWGFSDGARKVGVDGEIISYAILDVLAKPVFGFWLLIAHERMPASGIKLDGAWTHGFSSGEGSLRVGDDDDET